MKPHELIRKVAAVIRSDKGRPIAPRWRICYRRAAFLIVAACRVDDPTFLERRAAMLVLEGERLR